MMMMKLHGLVKWEDSASWYTEVGKNMVTLHGEEVKVGDKVWHVRYGWGEVSGVDDDEDTNYPILVHWDGRDALFTEDGKFYFDDKTPTLFWQPIVFEIPKKP